MPFMADDAPGRDLVGRTAIDAAGSTVGTVTDVIADPETGNAKWAVIDLGLFKREHYAPLAHAYRTEDNGLVLDVDKRFIAEAPKAAKDERWSPEIDAQLAEYYSVSS